MLRTARAFLFKKMEKRYVLTLKQRPDGTYEVKLDNGLNAIYLIESLMNLWIFLKVAR